MIILYFSFKIIKRKTKVIILNHAITLYRNAMQRFGRHSTARSMGQHCSDTGSPAARTTGSQLSGIGISEQRRRVQSGVKRSKRQAEKPTDETHI